MELATLVYGAVAGTGLATAAVFLALASSRRSRDVVTFPVAVMAVLLALSAVVTIWMHTRSTLDDYEAVFSGPFSWIALASMVGLIALVAAWTAYAPRLFLILFGLWSAVLAVLLVVLAEPLLSGEITGLREVSFLGQDLVVHESEGSPWRPVLDAYLLVSFGYIIIAMIRQFRHGNRGDALAFTIGVGGVVAFAAFDSAVDAGAVSTPYLAPFGFLFLVVACAARVSSRVSAMAREVEDHATHLEELVEIRTVELIDANERLEAELVKQQLAAQRLADLTNRFDDLNNLSARDRETQDLVVALEGLLDSLGPLLDADSVLLALEPDTSVRGLPPQMAWSSAGAIAAPESADSIAAKHEREIDANDQTFGRLIVKRSGEAGLTDQSRRFVELACELLGGLLHRLQLIDQLAAEAVDAERQRISHEIHDSITQRLYAVTFLAQALPRQLEVDSDKAAGTAGQIRALLLSALAELRALLYELRPAEFEAADLGQLLEDLAEAVAGGFEVDVTVEAGEAIVLPPEVKLGLYRIAQEALSNAWRHSQAEAVSIALDGSDESRVTLMIVDDGVGLDEATLNGDGELTSLRERARSIGAELEVAGNRPSGLSVSARWPYDAGASVPSPSPIEGVDA